MDMKHSLVQSLKLVAYWIIASIVMSALLAAIYMIYMLNLNLVAGERLAFDAKLYAEGILLFTPLVLMSSAVMLSFHMIRHPVSSVIPLIAYAVICVSSWIFLIPGIASYNSQNLTSYIEKSLGSDPSAGYFRRNGDKIVFYSSVNKQTRLVNGLCIDTSDAGNNVRTFSYLGIPKKQSGYTDSLIQNSVEMPPALKILVKDGSRLLALTQECARRSFGCWLCFATMGLALLGVVSLRGISKWRLVNVMLIVGVTIGVLWLNVLGYTNDKFAAVENTVNNGLSNIPGIRSLAVVGNPVMMLCNVLIFIVLVVVFFCVSAMQKRRGEDADEDEEEDF